MARVREVGRGGEEEEGGTDSCCRVREEDELFLSVVVLGLAAPEAESESESESVSVCVSASASASRSQPESSNTMSKEEEVQSLGPRGGQSSKESRVSEASRSAWLPRSDVGPSRPGSGRKDRPPSSAPKPAPALPESGARVSTEFSRTSPPGPRAGDSELDTGTLTDSASIHLWSISSCQPSGGLSCQALK
ncbi:hypothetical protein EYF80_050196 [Liparis tanakae]|uniref:Uncharacterized protein n=1 Tax=Liparis tanakae TaxID=230148 RepID=A0A4Z2FER7_9TELE|nr:hypothetical protein EYF80_050196 [Liparis tanakae]